MLETSERHQVKEILKHYPYLLRSGHRTRHHAGMLAVVRAAEQYQVSQVTAVHSEQSQHFTLQIHRLSFVWANDSPTID